LYRRAPSSRERLINVSAIVVDEDGVWKIDDLEAD
jgi:hypothetical protein